MANEPKTLIEAVRHFADPDVTLNAVIRLRWPDGVACPTCGSKDVSFITTRRIWKCKTKHKKQQFSAKIGSIFEDSPLPLDYWFVAIWSIANCKNGISSYELGRALGITQKSAWFMLHRIRTAMKAGSINMPSQGRFEADESLLGGRLTNMHADKRDRARMEGRTFGKSVVMAIVRRKTAGLHSKVRAIHVKDASEQSLQSVIGATIEPGSHIYTDMWQGYRGLSVEYRHEMVDHALQHVRDAVHTNSCENFFSLLKRTIKGTYVSVEPFHLGRYLDEQAFRFNERKDNDGGWFETLLGSVFGLRLTWKELTGHDAQPT